MPSSSQARHDALSIWKAGVDAVRSDRLVSQTIDRVGDALRVADRRFAISSLNRIAVVGGGKAGAGMAAAVEVALGPNLVANKLIGWVNVPADCLRTLARIHLHPARPGGVNEPTPAGVEGSDQILRMVRALGGPDLCLVLLSGGGSALLPAPPPPITLAEKLAVTRWLASRGATITELNTVRKRLSRIKGGRLARASRAGQMVALIISDIVGDPLDMIASGPTTPDTSTDAQALAILRKFRARPPAVPQSVIEFLQRGAGKPQQPEPFPVNVANYLIGNNAMALSAAASEAESRGYRVISLGSENTGEANAEGQALAARCVELRAHVSPDRPVCLLSGGEPVVRLVETERPGKGGRNQQLVLAALIALGEAGLDHFVILSGGTDGEDGSTDAAGAWADAELLRDAHRQGLDPRSYLQVNDAYTFFAQTGGLIQTGPTHTNVMDLRVALVWSVTGDG